MNPFLLFALGLFAMGAIAQSPNVWDEREGEWVSLSEFSRRYASLGPGALRLSQTGPSTPAFTADIRLLRDPPRIEPTPPPRLMFGTSPMQGFLMKVDK